MHPMENLSPINRRINRGQAGIFHLQSQWNSGDGEFLGRMLCRSAGLQFGPLRRCQQLFPT